MQSALLEAMQERQVTIGDKTLPAAGAVPRAGHAEPDRAGGHVPAARGAGRPLHAEAQGRLPEPRRRAADHGSHDRRRCRAKVSAARARREQLLEARKVVRDVYMDESVKDYIVDLVFATREPSRRAEGSGAADRVRRVPARHDRAEPRRARARVPAPPRLRHARGREGDRPRRAPPPHRPELRGRGRGGQPPRTSCGACSRWSKCPEAGTLTILAISAETTLELAGSLRRGGSRRHGRPARASRAR